MASATKCVHQLCMWATLYEPRCHPSILQQFNYTSKAQMSVLPPHLSGLCPWMAFFLSLSLFWRPANQRNERAERVTERFDSIYPFGLHFTIAPEQFICIETCTYRALNKYKYADRILRQQLSKSIPLTRSCFFFVFFRWTALCVWMPFPLPIFYLKL